MCDNLQGGRITILQRGYLTILKGVSLTALQGGYLTGSILQGGLLREGGGGPLGGQHVLRLQQGAHGERVGLQLDAHAAVGAARVVRARR